MDGLQIVSCAGRQVSSTTQSNRTWQHRNNLQQPKDFGDNYLYAGQTCGGVLRLVGRYQQGICDVNARRFCGGCQHPHRSMAQTVCLRVGNDYNGNG